MSVADVIDWSGVTLLVLFVVVAAALLEDACIGHLERGRMRARLRANQEFERRAAAAEMAAQLALSSESHPDTLWRLEQERLSVELRNLAGESTQEPMQ